MPYYLLLSFFTYLTVMVLNLNEPDDVHHDYDDDLDLDTLDYYSILKCLHSVQMLVVHDHDPSQMYYIVCYSNLDFFDMINAVDTDDVENWILDRNLSLFRDT